MIQLPYYIISIVISWLVGVYAPWWILLVAFVLIFWGVLSEERLEDALLHIAAPWLVPAMFGTCLFGDFSYIGSFFTGGGM